MVMIELPYKYTRHTKIEIEQRLRQVENLSQQGKNCKEISKEMKIPLSTVSKYLRTVAARRNSMREELQEMNSQDSLQNMALLILKKYRDLAKVCNEIKKDPSKSAYDRTQAGKTELACLNNELQMLKNPPLNTILGNKEVSVKKKKGFEIKT